MQDLVNPQTRSWRLGATMFGAFGALALILAAVGLYSMLAYDVAQRTHELGVRVALGARATHLARSVTGSGLRMVAVGAAAGLGLTLLAGHLIEPLLFQTSPHEPLVLVTVVALLLAVAVLATALPAWRAIRVDPIVALRTE
jgi:ABC-type antimicrobial peptide transport system permease subunit